MPKKVRTDAAIQNEQSLKPEDIARILQALFAKTVQELREQGAPGEHDRFFFPQGIQRIHIVLTIGPKEAPIVSVEVDVSGQRGA